MNLLDVEPMGELRSLLTSIPGDESIRVIVFDSADPEFFIAHADMTIGDDPHVVSELLAKAPE